MTLYVRKSTAAWSAGMLFLIGTFIGLEVSGYIFHQQDAKPAFVRIPPQPEPVDVIQGMSCREAASKALLQCRMSRVKRG